MDRIINKILLNGDKFMPELQLKQPGVTYSDCGLFIKHHKRIQKFKETGNVKHLYRNKLDKAYFAHYAGHSGSKDLGIRIILAKILKDRACEIARNSQYDGHQGELASMVYNFFDKKTGLGVSVNEQLAIT